MNLGDQKTKVTFGSLAEKVADFAERGVGLLVVIDSLSVATKKVKYFSLNEVEETEYSAQNYKYISDFFSAPTKPKALIVLSAATIADIEDFLDLNVREDSFNYMAVPNASDTGNETWNDLMQTWIESRNADSVSKNSVLIAHNLDGDSPFVINWTQGSVILDGEGAGNEKTMALLMGYICSVSGSQLSINAYDLTDRISEEGTLFATGTDELSKAGKIFLVRRNGKIQFSRQINSLVTLVAPYANESYKFIDVFDETQFIANTIVETWESQFKDRGKNTYSYKSQFVDLINKQVIKQELNENLLDPSQDNFMEVDWAKHDTYIFADGLDPADLTEKERKEYNTDNEVFTRVELEVPTSAADLYAEIFI